CTTMLQATGARTDFLFERLIFIGLSSLRSGCFRALRELREVALDDALAETRFEHVLLASHLVAAVRLEVFAPQAAADTHGQVRAVAALLPGPELEQRSDFFRRLRRDLRHLEARKSGDHGALVDTALGVDGVVVLPVQLAGPEYSLECRILVCSWRHLPPVD